jgi:hypothetical protein
MDFLREYPISTDPISPLRSNISNSINTGKNGSHGFLHKLFSRQPSIPKHVTSGLEDQSVHSLFDSADDSSQIGFEAMPCPYIHPLGNRLEPRVESATLAPRRQPTDSAMSISRNEGEMPRPTRSCLSIDNADEESHSNLSASDAMSLRSSMLREDIAVAATADVSHLKDWDYYIKCYSEVRLCTSSYIGISNFLGVIN